MRLWTGRVRAAPLDLAIVGCGAVVEQLYRRPLQALEARHCGRVVALVDPDPARTAALGRHFRSARAFSSLAEALAARSPSLVIVTSPPGLHAAHAVAAFEAGSHVLCEKPMAIRVEDAELMVAAARAAQRILAVGMTRRMYPSLVDARALIAAGVLGDDVRFVYREGHVYDWPVSTDAVFRRASAGGGVLMDYGSHVLDMLSVLFGAMNVVAYADDGHGDGVEANCQIALDGRDVSGMVQLSWNQPLVTGLGVTGTAGELVLDPRRIDELRWRPHAGEARRRVSDATWPSDLELNGRSGTPRNHHECIYYQLVQVLRAIMHGEAVPADGEQGLALTRSIDACYLRATLLRLSWLTEDEQLELDKRHWSRQRCAAA